MNFSVTQYGIQLDKREYYWDESSKIFKCVKNNLVLDFNNIEGVIFTIGDDCMCYARNNCMFHAGENCVFRTGFGCMFTTGSGCVFDTMDGCKFRTDDDCTFNTLSNCSFVAKTNCSFNTGADCEFETGRDCMFFTGPGCVFYKTQPHCSLYRKDTFDLYYLPENEMNIKLNSYGISGHIRIELAKLVEPLRLEPLEPINKLVDLTFLNKEDILQEFVDKLRTLTVEELKDFLKK